MTKRKETTMVKRKGELTGKHAVFYGSLESEEMYVVIAQVGEVASNLLDGHGDPLPELYDWEPLLAFSISDGRLLLLLGYYSSLAPYESAWDGALGPGDILASFDACADAYIYAHGLLSEGRRAAS